MPYQHVSFVLFFINRPRVLHLYIGQTFELVQELSVSSQIVNEEDEMLEGTNKMIKGIWLIQIKPLNNENEKQIQMAFQSARLRFNSLVFAYHKGVKSKINIDLSSNIKESF